MATLLVAIGALFAACFGAIFGSYATLFAYRLPRGESCFGRYFGRKSRCPNCETIIKTRDLIPIINWLITLGKCRNCHIKIPRTHLFIELSCTIMFVLCYLKFSFSEDFMLYALISVGSIILIVTHFTHKVFPHEILIFTLVVAVAARVLHDYNVIDVTLSATMGAIAAAIFYKIFYGNSEIFGEEKQLFSFMQFILITSVLLSPSMFILYFVIILLSFSVTLLLDLNKHNFSLAAVLIMPFLATMLCPPILS